MSAVPIIVGYALRESLRRKVFLIVLALTAVFLVLYGFGVDAAYDAAEEFRAEDGAAGLVDEEVLFAATFLGLAMFGTLFLGTVLAIFLTHAAIRGDAERGLLQPLVVRPVGRAALLTGRFAAAAAVCSLYVAAVFGVALLLTHAVTGWWPDRVAVPALELIGAVVVLVALSLLGSVFLSAIANGIAVFMVFGAGLVAGLIGQIGEALANEDLEAIATWASWALPFEALYQDGLNGLTADTTGFTAQALSLGPFGGAQEAGAGFAPYVLVYLAAVAALALAGFRRRDL